ncbi:TPA: beta-1,6-N-acetylglucosaminyltransferase [Clostridium perfringens]|nr:beta-1,6-N-acetylglucosaminyltransferase [Clostridium perfringens]HAT4129109.1 beta-1,6-N-acetylglucosaminyltransferase [Clostridium perfringens]
MKIAYIILCHIDSTHISRLANKISNENCDVFIHVDIESNINDFKKKLEQNKHVYFVENRVKAYWGGFSAIEATINTIELARKIGEYERYILLQGLDYPIVSNDYIYKFFLNNKDIEFIRACNITDSKNKKLYSKCKMYWFFDKKNFWRKCLNRFNLISGLKTRKGYVKLKDKKFNVYWGAAQWALTGQCIDYIIKFYNKNYKFNKYFQHIFPADETYFHSIIFNSKFSKNTINKGAEKENDELENWRNIHYFEYPKLIKIFKKEDYKYLKSQNCLFIRKTTTKDSSELLDLIDKDTN